MAPPLTRGSTQRPFLVHLVPLGSPAHAGINPLHAAISIHKHGLPRSRGDQPHCSGAAEPNPMAPPLTRGSTREFSEFFPRATGSPAHAGINPAR